MLSMDRIDPICGYIGGKWRWADQIVPVIMSAPNKPDKYYEIFGGMAGVLVRKPRHHIETWNDINKDLYYLFKHLTDPELFIKFKEVAKYDIHSFDLFHYFLDTLKDDELFRAYRTYHLLKHSYGSQGKTWSRKIVKPASVYEEDVIDKFHDRIKYVNIESMDFRDFIEKYDRDDAVAYLDPPYMISTEKGHYINNFTEHDHRQLSELLKYTEMSWVLSYDDHPLVRDLYDGFNFGTTTIPYGTINTKQTNGKREYRTELLITNFNYAKQKSLMEFL